MNSDGQADSPGAVLQRALDRHARRPVCREGLRRITVDVFLGDTVQVRLEIAQAWHVESGSSISILSVLPSSPFGGTTVLMRERAFAHSPAIWVWPTTATRPVLADQWRCEEHLLGTDFSYDDIRLFTPRMLTAATGAEPDGDGFLIRSAWTYRGRRRVNATGRLDEHGLLVAADLVAEGMHDPFRTLRAEGIVMVDGMATPTMIQVARPAEGFRSVLRLVAMDGSGRSVAVPSTPDRLRDAGAELADAAVGIGTSPW
ncbi:hypothetical protein ACWEHA_17540 [Amycolatopsis nivea]